MPKVKVNNILINYEEYGNQKDNTLIFIPGLGGNTKLWYKQAPFFANYFRVICIDNRGAGESEKPIGPYTIDMFSEDLRSFIHELNIKKPIIIGASFGGLIAQVFVHENPDIISKLVLVCTGVAPLDPHYVPMENEILQKIINPGQTREEKINNILDIFYHPEYIKNNPEIKEYYLNRKVDESQNQAYFWQLAATKDSRPSFEWLKEIKCSVLIMHGENDRIWKVKNAYVLKEGIGEKAELFIMKDAEHMFFQEKAEEFNERLLKFLKN